MNIKAWVLYDNQARRNFANLYVDLLSRDGVVMASTTLPVWRGEAAGGLAIPADIPESVCYLHAYTTATQKTGKKYGYLVPVPVVREGTGQILVRDTTLSWKASAHVEGGHLLSGQPTRIALRMHSRQPQPFDWSAEIRDELGHVMAVLTDKDDNVASGWMVPRPGVQYTVFVRDSRGQTQSVALPPVQDTGAYLQVNPGLKSIQYRVLLKGMDMTLAPFKVRGRQGNQNVYHATMVRERMEAAADIPLDSLDPGPLYLELVDATGRILAERLCFIPVPPMPAKQLVDSMSTPQRKRAEQTFQVKGDGRFLRVFAYARTVTDIGGDEQDNLLSQLYLSSLSSDPFILPARYFLADSNKHLLDALYMSLTKEYGEQLLEAGSKILADSLLSYQGMAYDLSGPVVEQDINLVISTGQQETIFRQVRTDRNGSFLLDKLYFEDSAVVYFQLNQVRDKDRNDLKVTLNRLPGPERKAVDFPGAGWMVMANRRAVSERTLDDVIDASRRTEEAVASQYRSLEEIRISTQKKSQTQQLDEMLSSGPMGSADARMIDLVNNYPEAAGFTNIFSFLQGKFPALQFAMENAEWVPYYRGRSIAIMIDEVPATASLANLLVPANLALIKLLNYNFVSGGPVLAIYTRRGILPAGNPTYVTGMNAVTIRGYGKQESRVAVNHSDSERYFDGKDNRLTLFWSQVLYDWDTEKMEPIRFFRNDSGSPYRMTIVGVQEDGIPVLLLDQVF